MYKFFLSLFFFFCFKSFSQTGIVKDSIYLLNGQMVSETVIDTLLGAVTIINPEKPEKKIHYELDDIYMVSYKNGYRRYYYSQDSLKNNWFTRNEMWYFMKGERDARKGFKARGALIGSGIAGLIGGMSGTFFGPVLPYGYLALVGLPKVRIRANTISNPVYVDYDAYILGYERNARSKRRIQSIIGGTTGLIIGYGLYALLHNYYPEEINIGFNKK